VWTAGGSKNVKLTRGLGSVTKEKAGHLLISSCSRGDEEEGEKAFNRLLVMTVQTREMLHALQLGIFD